MIFRCNVHSFVSRQATMIFNCIRNNFRFTPELGRIDLKGSGNEHEASALRDEVCHLSEDAVWMASKIG